MSNKRSIIERVGGNLATLKKSANVSFEKIALATDISLSHVRNACSGEANISLLYLEKFANFFGVDEARLLEESFRLPDRKELQNSIEKYLISTGFSTVHNFKELGPTFIVESFLQKDFTSATPLFAGQIKDLINQKNKTSYKTNDVSRVLNNLSEQGIIHKIDTGNPKKPKYEMLRTK